MKRILFAVMMALIVTAAFGASEPYRMPDGSTVEVMHPGVDGVTRPMARADATVVPAYPQLPQPLGEDSTVVMAVLVDKRGDAVTLEVLDSSHPGLGFEDSAAEALFKWKFDPARSEGKPVVSYTKVRVNFPQMNGGGGSSGLVGSMVPGGADLFRDRNMAGSMTPTMTGTNAGKAAAPGTAPDSTPEAPASAGHEPPGPRVSQGPSFQTAPQGQLYFRGHPEWGYKVYGGEPPDSDAPWR